MSQRFTDRTLAGLPKAARSSLLIRRSALGFSWPREPRLGGGPAWPLHIKCGPGVSEDMPSATWAAANGAGAQIGAAGAAVREYRCREEEWREWGETKGGWVEGWESGESGGAGWKKKGE